MTISRFKLLAFSVLMCAISIQNSYADEAKTIQKKVATLALHVAAFNAVVLPLNRMRTDNWGKARRLSLEMTGLYLGLRGLYSFVTSGIPWGMSKLYGGVSKIYDVTKLKFDKDYRTRELVEAVYKKNSERIDQLLWWGADPNSTYTKSPSSYWILVPGYQSVSYTSHTSLTMACMSNNPDIAKQLLRSGANPNIKKGEISPLEIGVGLHGDTPLAVIASMYGIKRPEEASNDYRDIIKILLAAGAEYKAEKYINCSDEMKQFLDYHAYHSRSDYKKTLSALAKSKKLPEDIELHFVNLLHGQKAAKDEAEKRKEKSRRESALRAIEEVGLE